MAKPTKPRAPQTISLDALSNVTGGRTSAAAPGATAPSAANATAKSSLGDPNSQMMSLLTEIVSSLQDMNQQRNQDPFMRAVMLMQAMKGMNSGGPFGGGGSPF